MFFFLIIELVLYWVGAIDALDKGRISLHFISLHLEMIYSTVRFLLERLRLRY